MESGFGSQSSIYAAFIRSTGRGPAARDLSGKTHRHGPQGVTDPVFRVPDSLAETAREVAIG